MTTPLTPEQVAELRLPSWFCIEPTKTLLPGDAFADALAKLEPWSGMTNDNTGAVFSAPKSELAIAQLAEHVANGHLPPATLTAAWSILDGTAEWRAHNGDELEEHVTEYAAEQDALDSISDARDEDEWPDWIDYVEYGLWIPFAKATRCNECEGPDGEDQCDYRLERVVAK